MDDVHATANVTHVDEEAVSGRSGSLPLVSAILARADTLGIADHVSFAGDLSSWKQIPSEMRRAHLFLSATTLRNHLAARSGRLSRPDPRRLRERLDGHRQVVLHAAQFAATAAILRDSWKKELRP